MQLERRPIEASPEAEEIIELWTYFMRQEDPEIKWDAYSRLQKAADLEVVPRWLPDLFWAAYFETENPPTARG